jgi:hypothetical protein
MTKISCEVQEKSLRRYFVKHFLLLHGAFHIFQHWFFLSRIIRWLHLADIYQSQLTTRTNGKSGGRVLSMSVYTSSWRKTMCHFIPLYFQQHYWEPRNLTPYSTVLMPQVRLKHTTELNHDTGLLAFMLFLLRKTLPMHVCTFLHFSSVKNCHNDLTRI